MEKSTINFLVEKFTEVIPHKQIFTDKLNRLAYGTDASFYRLIPEVVVKVKNHEEAKAVIDVCQSANVPLTFRAAGTSLSGQAVTDSVLMVIDRDWSGYIISEDKTKISLEPAVIGAFANAYLKPHNKKIGPDPASINAAMVGGIAANNASGMCCGTAQNSYNTLSSMKIIFADGSELDTADKNSIQHFIETHPELIKSLNELHSETVENTELANLIRHKYKMKNTTGYSINSIVNFENPIEMIQHLMIGSEGTIGFISEITYQTVDELPNKASALIIFNNIHDACKAVFDLKKQPVDAVELMDRASLHSVENKTGMPGFLKTLDENATALLIETSADSKNNLQQNIDLIKNSLTSFDLVREIEFTDIPSEYALLWNIRKGLFPSVGAMRESGTTVVIEDVAFPLDKLADAAIDLQNLFRKYNYTEAIIFGHVLEGNFHFVFNQDFNDEVEVKRYKDFMDEVVKMTAGKYKGSLKAEHGTGRNMAPFVKYEWGEEAYRLMKEIKNIFDPKNILNPGVILNQDNNIHIKNLKPMPKAKEIVDKCIECGFCENNCPSKDLTLTPRQRIVVYREISRLNNAGTDYNSKNELESLFSYYGEETCAVDGLCELTCPVNINTGKLIKELRFEKINGTANSFASVLANHLAPLTSAGRSMLNLVDITHKTIGTRNLNSIAGGVRKLSGNKIPAWNRWLPAGTKQKFASNEKISNNGINSVVYFPSCISRTMGLAKDSSEGVSQISASENLLKKAGYEILYPKAMENLCCGMPWASKGFKDQADQKSDELLVELKRISNNGEIPVLFDTSPCAYHLHEYIKDHDEFKNIKIFEPVEFIHDHLLDKLKIEKTDKQIAIHTTCSSTKMGLTDKFKAVAEACSNNVVIPEKVTCCGFAGDRGFSHPELNESALHHLKDQVDGCECGYSNSKTCEIGLSEHSGIEYKSIVYLVDEVSE